ADFGRGVWLFAASCFRAPPGIRRYSSASWRAAAAVCYVHAAAQYRYHVRRLLAMAAGVHHYSGREFVSPRARFRGAVFGDGFAD
nr:hypothetical protein [Tanacetum cinerariifolium]